MPEIHDSSFVINDVVLSIPPTDIQITDVSSHKSFLPVRSRTAIKGKSSRSVLNVSFSAYFTTLDDINNRLRFLLAQFRLTPFCYVENTHLRNAVMGEVGIERSMALALQSLVVESVPDQPGTLKVNFSFLWFNYLPYSPDFAFKDSLVDQYGRKTPGHLFRLFYAPQLRLHREVTSQSNSDIDIETLEWLVSASEDDLDDRPVSETELENIRKQTLSHVRDFEKLVQEIENPDNDAEAGTSPLNDRLRLMAIKLQTDPNSLSRKQVADLLRTLSEKSEELVKQRDGDFVEDKLLRRLAKKTNQIVEVTSKTGRWFEFPREPLAGENSFGEDKGSKSKLYYREKALQNNSRIVVEHITIAYQHNLAVIPMAGHQYPTVQYMGSSDATVALAIKAVGDEAVQSITSFWNTSKNNLAKGKYIPRQLCNVYLKNELVQLFGFEEVIPDQRSIVTIPGNPGTYDVQLTFLEAGIKAEEREGLKPQPHSFHTVRKKVWKAIFDNIQIKDGFQSRQQRDMAFVPTAGLSQAETEFLNGLIRYDYERYLGAGEAVSEGINYWIIKLITDFSEVDTISFEKVFNLEGPFTVLSAQTGKDLLQNSFALSEDEVYGIAGLTEKLYSYGRENGTVQGELSGIQTLRSNFFRNNGEIQEGLRSVRNTAQAIRQTYSETGQEGDYYQDLVEFFYADWNAFAAKTADFIMNTYLHFSIFAEARAELDRIVPNYREHVYSDFPMEEIKNNVLLDLGETARNLTNSLIVEPDFYFMNRSYDLGNTELVSAETKEEVKRLTEAFSANVVKENTTWYQKQYIQKFGIKARNFILSSQDQDLLASPATREKNHQSSNLIKKNLTSTSIVSGNYTLRNGEIELFGDNVDPILNVRGEVNPPILDISLPNAPEPVTNNVSNYIGSDTSVWADPLLNTQRFTSLPGWRPGTASFHYGTDLTLGSRDETYGAPVVASFSGTISKISTGAQALQSRQGISVNIESVVQGEKIVHKYFHLLGVPDYLSEGQKVITGDLIGWCGNTGTFRTKTGDQDKAGTHLHFEVRSFDYPNTVIYPFGSYRWEEIDYSSRYENITIQARDFIPFKDNTAAATLPRDGNSVEASGSSLLDLSSRYLNEEIRKVTGWRMNRAYPGIYLSFIEEDADDHNFRYDDFYSYSSIVSLDIVRDRKVAADFCELVLTNISGLLSNRSLAGTFFEDLPSYNGELAQEDPEKGLLVDTDKENAIDSLLLKDGIKVEIRLGYSDQVQNLEPVIVGRLVGVQFNGTDDLVELHIQSLATELVQDLKGTQDVESKDGWFVSDGNTAPLLADMISSPEATGFGYWKRGKRWTNQNRDLLTQRWEWNPNPGADNIFAPDSRPLDPAQKEGLSRFLRGDFNTSDAFSLLNPVTALSRLSALAVESSFKSAFTAAKGPVKAARDPTQINGDEVIETESFLLLGSSMSYFLYNTTIWDVFKEMELRHPEYISSPVPYYEINDSVARMTMFFGLPDQLYFAKDPGYLPFQAYHEERAIRFAQINQTTLIDDYLENPYQEVGEYIEPEYKAVGKTPFGAYKLDRAVDRNFNYREKTKIREQLKQLINKEKADFSLKTGSIQPFRKYHLITSQHHIVSNNIRVRSSDTFNTATVQYAPDDSNVITLTGEPKIVNPSYMTMKLDPSIPEEYVRENFTVFPNCQGEEMAKRYCVSLLSKGVWDVYSGEITILGNPNIKPYDICFLYDDYSDMYGAFQVQRVQHMFSHETGFITILVPDCINTPNEGVGMTQNHAMALMGEAVLKNLIGDEYFIATGNDFSTMTPGAAPGDGVNINPTSYLLTVGAGKFLNLFGAKRLLFKNQFNWPIRVQPLLHHGRAMVAGFGPGHVMQNEFKILDTGTWVPALKGLSEAAEDWTRAISDGIFNPRGQLGVSNIVGGVKRRALIGENKLRGE